MRGLDLRPTSNKRGALAIIEAGYYIESFTARRALSVLALQTQRFADFMIKESLQTKSLLFASAGCTAGCTAGFSAASR